jgi:biopolymer transport protein ExbD
MKFRNVSKIEPIPLQLAPLIDVLLLLLLFFIITMNLSQRETEMDIKVPAADEGAINPDRQVGEIVVNVRKDGTIIVEGAKLTEEQLLAKLKIIASVHKDQAVIYRGDKGSTYEHTINVMDVCRKAGIWNVSFATRPPEDETTPAAPAAPPSVPAPPAPTN